MLKGEIFQHYLHPVNPQPVSQRRVYLHGFFGDGRPSFGGLILQCFHVVDAVGQTDHENTDIGGHGQYHFAEIFSLFLFLGTQRNAAYFS